MRVLSYGINRQTIIFYYKDKELEQSKFLDNISQKTNHQH